MVKGRNQGTQKQRETERQIQSRRVSRPSHAMEVMDQRGTLLPSTGEAKEEEEGGGLSPPLSRWSRSAARAIITTTIYTNNFTAVITNSSPSMKWCNPSFTRCNLYLNMVLNAIYYFPMTYGCPMMFQ